MSYVASDMLDAEIAARTAPLPRVLWIELTSRCPFDCVFCSRKLLRGAGQHMDFALYARLIAELDEPEIVRLNYSGESANYPRLVEACELAAATGAQVELVTALAAMPEYKLEPLARSGLTRLSVSLHTLDAQQFADIYRFSNLPAMRRRIERVVKLAALAPRPLTIDFAFVAMRRNLDQLSAVADYAVTLGLPRLAIHPVIRRDPIDETFPDELDGDRLRSDFLTTLAAAIANVRGQQPSLNVEVSTPELESNAPLSHEPRYYPGELPTNARIFGCDQDPWDTTHILADGSVVSCEERDHTVLGSLRDTSLRDIWHGAAYRAFRLAHLNAIDAKCRRCPYKLAHLPAPPSTRIQAGSEGTSALLAGWHNEPGATVQWSKRRAQLRLAASGPSLLRLRGLLPPGGARQNALHIHANGAPLACIKHRGGAIHAFTLERRIVAHDGLLLGFEVTVPFCPHMRGLGRDMREIGFGLIEAEVLPYR